MAEGNEKADELAEAGAMLDEGLLYGRSESRNYEEREREEVCAALRYAACFHC